MGQILTPATFPEMTVSQSCVGSSMRTGGVAQYAGYVAQLGATVP